MAALLVAASVTACAALLPRPSSTSASIETPSYVKPSSEHAPRVALVLSGGSARGFAHLGVLRVLEREGLRPDLVVGSSAGAIAGALYASGMQVADIETLAERLDWLTVVDIDPVRSLLGGIGLGLAKGERLELLLREHMPSPMQAFPTRFAAVATDLNTGETVALNHGDAARALRASMAIPGLLAPVSVGTRLLGDGQIVSPLPVATARQLGARIVIAVDVMYPPQQASLSNPMSVLFQTMIISSYRQLERERGEADLVISPRIRPTTGQLGLGDRHWLVETGVEAAEGALPQLLAAFGSE